MCIRDRISRAVVVPESAYFNLDAKSKDSRFNKHVDPDKNPIINRRDGDKMGELGEINPF